MAPKKKKPNDKPPKDTLKRAQKPKKPSPKIVKVIIGSAVALDQLQASSGLSPKQAKTPPKQTNSPDTVMKPVKKRTSDIKNNVNKTTQKDSEDDSVTPQELTVPDSPVKRKYIKKTTKKHSVDDLLALQKQLVIPVTRLYVNKTTDKYSVGYPGTPQEQIYTPVSKTTNNHSVDDSVAPKEQLDSPVTRNYANKTRNYVNKTIKKHSADDSVAPQEQLHSPVTRKQVNKTTKKHSVDDSAAPQEQLHSPVKRKYINKTTKKHSVDDSVVPQEQFHSPVKRKYIHKTTKKHSEDDSVTQQEQSHSPVTRKYDHKTTEKQSVDYLVTPREQLHITVTRKHVNKTTEKHSVDDSVKPQEQLHSPLKRKYINKTTEKRVDDSVAPQEQLHSPVKRKYIHKTTKKHSEDDSVTQQEQSHSPVTRKYDHKTTEKQSVDYLVTPQEQLHIPVTSKHANKTTEKHNVDNSVKPQEQLHSPVIKKYINKNTEKHVDDSVTQQEQSHSPVTRKYDHKTTEKQSVDYLVTPQEQLHIPVTSKHVNKTTEKHSVDDSVKPQEQLHSPLKRKYINKTTEKHIDDSVTQQEQSHSPVTGNYDNKSRVVHSVEDSKTVVHMKKRPGPNSRTMFEVKKKLVCPVSKSIEEPVVIKEQKSIKSANISPDNSSDILSKEGLATTECCENDAARPIIRPRETPKGSALTKSKIPNEKEIQNATPVLVKVIENISPPPQSNNRPNSVSSNKSNLTWTKDISTKSNISSSTNNCVTVTSSVPFNNKLEQLENPEQQNVKDDNLKQMYLREISRNESSSSDSESSSDTESISDSESSSASSSSSDWELRGVNTIPKPNLGTSSLTPRLPLSDEKIKFCRRKIKNMYKIIDDFKEYISTLCPHDDDDDLCSDSDILDGFNFDRDLEAMMQQVNNSEKLKHHRTADFLAQNGSEIRSLEESSRSSYEKNRSETSSPERYRLRQETVHNVSETELAKPCLARRVSASSSRDTSINLPEAELVSNMNQVEASTTDSFKTFTSDNYSYEPFDRTHDDDDSLSLYAESISGVNSSRLDSGASVSNVSVHDVYVPKYSPTACMREKYVYKPTKIQGHRSNPAEESTEDGEIITNADEEAKKISRACASSSGSSAKNKTEASGLLEDSNRTSAIAEESIKRVEAQISSQPRRLFSSYQKINPVRSSLYRGVCFFFIASQCKNISCRFIHAIVNINTFKFRLQILDKDTLIAEYLLMCGYESLKRKYFLLFVEECNRRQATRILFEMAIDLGLGFLSIDEDIRVEVLETALLHLNTISIDACDDLLTFEHEGTMMCDALLSCMANSQNFAQFKPAFVKLANLMCELNRPVDIQVASSILERVCILPGEDLLARGMLVLMKNTDVSIFENNLACSFELQLANIDSDIHAAYLLAKKAALEGRLAQLDETYPTTPPIMPCVVLNTPRQTRPDSNNVDNLQEPLPPVYSTPRRFVAPRRPLWRKC